MMITTAGNAQAIEVVEFIAENTRLMAPPLVPEISLHLADETLPIWRKTEEQLGELGVPSPFWAFAWAGGQALARYILDRPEETVAGKTVLDLGTGSGLVAIAAKRAGATDVAAVDVDRFATAATGMNAAANDVAIRIFTSDFPAAEISQTVDVVLVGDLFYDQRLAAKVTAFADRMAQRGTLVLAGDPKRSYFPGDKFERIKQFSVPVTRELEDAEIKNTAVWRLSFDLRDEAKPAGCSTISGATQWISQD